MALDPKAIVTFGYYPTDSGELYVRIASNGFLGFEIAPIVSSIVEYVSVLSIKLKSALRI